MFSSDYSFAHPMHHLACHPSNPLAQQMARDLIHDRLRDRVNLAIASDLIDMEAPGAFGNYGTGAFIQRGWPQYSQSSFGNPFSGVNQFSGLGNPFSGVNQFSGLGNPFSGVNPLLNPMAALAIGNPLMNVIGFNRQPWMAQSKAAKETVKAILRDCKYNRNADDIIASVICGHPYVSPLLRGDYAQDLQFDQAVRNAANAQYHQKQAQYGSHGYGGVSQGINTWNPIVGLQNAWNPTVGLQNIWNASGGLLNNATANFASGLSGFNQAYGAGLSGLGQAYGPGISGWNQFCAPGQNIWSLV